MIFETLALSLGIGIFSGFFRGALRVSLAIVTWCVTLSVVLEGQPPTIDPKVLAALSLLFMVIGSAGSALLCKKLLPLYDNPRFQRINSLVGILLLGIIGAAASVLSNSPVLPGVLFGTIAFAFLTGYFVVHGLENKRKIHYQKYVIGGVSIVSLLLAVLLASYWPILFFVWTIEVWCGVLYYATTNTT